jgi:protein tyrosine/serine phosphatase
MRGRSVGYFALGLLVVATVVAPPVAYYRASYAHAKRFRIVTDGKLYRSGQFTADGLRQIIGTYGIKTVVNLQHENADPLMPHGWMGTKSVVESELCESLGVRYVQLDVIELVNPAEKGVRRPAVIDQFLTICDDPTAYPILIHCMAGLHRTGRLTAIYRMEYEGRSVLEAAAELKANGYGDFKCTDCDEYFVQYVREYVPGHRYASPPPQTDRRPGAQNSMGARP